MAFRDEIDPTWNFVDPLTAQQAATLMAGVNPYAVVFNPLPSHFRDVESGTTETSGIDKVFACFIMLTNAIKNRNLEADIKHSVRLRGGDDDKPGNNEAMMCKFRWFNEDEDDIGKRDLIYSTDPDWSYTTVRRADLVKWLKDIEYNDMYFNPKSGIGAGGYGFMNPEHPHYSPKLNAVVKAWLAFDDAETLESYLKKANSRTPKSAAIIWLQEHAGEIPELLEGSKNIKKLSDSTAESLAMIVHWKTEGGRP
jgi:hypothetical protein